MSFLRKFIFPNIFSFRNIYIQTQETPNPNSVKFLPGRSVLPNKTMEFNSLNDTRCSPLARQLLHIDGVKSCMVGHDFITINRIDSSFEWRTLKPEIFASLMDFFTSGVPIIDETLIKCDKSNEDDSETVTLIKEILDTRIRPTVQEDGGDITFVSFEDGVLKLQMKGACSNCPSSTVTLKSGVENMLKFYIDEVKTVEQVMDPVEEISRKEFEKFDVD